MRKSYGLTIWETLREYGVWKPGSPISVGDYGSLRDYSFQRHGNIADHIGEISLNERQSELDNLVIHSQAKSAVVGEASVAGALSKLRYAFNDKHGVLLLADGVSATTALDLNGLSTRLRQCETWERKWLVVTSLRIAKNFLVRIAANGQFETSISGETDVISALAAAKLQAMGRLEIEGGTGFKVNGTNGAISIELHRLRYIGEGFRHANEKYPIDAEELLVPYVTPVNQHDVES